ncbi:hypothetical protein [Methylotuvimicrobium buryatense]|uniref:hypothetical protein n=1 Tax=Methylotuvimicrobium buryatense TaxID=95641 RepID=UPI0003484D00|nr:hypothetical protein [Methylotuvimicrobium buryatense]
MNKYYRGQVSYSQFVDQKGCGVCWARMSAAGQIFAPRQLLLHYPNTRHPWRNAKSAFTPSLALSCRQAPMDGFTAFIDRHTPYPNDHEDLAIVPANERSWRGEGAVTRPTGRREYVHVGSTAAFPAADACQSSNRPLSGTGIVLSIEKSDKESKSANFHSNVHEGLAIAPANESSLVAEGAVTRPTGRREYVRVGSTAAFPAADACRSSNRPFSGTGIVLSIEKSDKESKSANFHSKIGETAQTGIRGGQGVLHAG